MSTFLAEVRGLPTVTAQIGLLVFIAGIALGRLLIGYLAKPERIRGLMTALFGLSALMLSLLFLVDFGPLTLPVTFLAGLTVSALLPLILAYAGLAFPAMAGTVMGAVKIAIPVGGIITPLLMSAVTSVSSFAVALLVVPAGLLCGLLILFSSNRSQNPALHPVGAGSLLPDSHLAGRIGATGQPEIKPLPVLEGSLPEGWKDAVYEDPRLPEK
jgi:predicted MFS family arabinose efflux permease